MACPHAANVDRSRDSETTSVWFLNICNTNELVPSTEHKKLTLQEWWNIADNVMRGPAETRCRIARHAKDADA